jgi:hypothetical protein
MCEVDANAGGSMWRGRLPGRRPDIFGAHQQQLGRCLCDRTVQRAATGIVRAGSRSLARLICVPYRIWTYVTMQVTQKHVAKTALTDICQFKHRFFQLWQLWLEVGVQLRAHSPIVPPPQRGWALWGRFLTKIPRVAQIGVSGEVRPFLADITSFE